MRTTFLLFFFAGIFSPVFSQTFSATVNTTIPDASDAIVSGIDVSGLPESIDTTFGVESICLNITHTWDADLEIKLIAPDGTVMVIILKTPALMKMQHILLLRAGHHLPANFNPAATLA
jgi:hypothetical protein